MAYFPMFVDLTDSNCLVVGGGSVALRKVNVLLDFGAKVHVIAREISIPDSSSIGQGSPTSRPRTSTSCQISGGILEISANKCNVLEPSQNHLPNLGLCEKWSSVKPVPGAKKWGTASG